MFSSSSIRPIPPTLPWMLSLCPHREPDLFITILFFWILVLALQFCSGHLLFYWTNISPSNLVRWLLWEPQFKYKILFFFFFLATVDWPRNWQLTQAGPITILYQDFIIKMESFFSLSFDGWNSECIYFGTIGSQALHKDRRLKKKKQERGKIKIEYEWIIAEG